ncbi:sulfurtransferase [Streptomyces sp. N2-109]|uniref:Sulfurtransferase n=1 Tax=Streptomyces gossypii TaxID=2883101 RepID=A0ABT2JQG3_9ACTN|nr:sulfurtransferase [Streptomyces gossypii]MCT2589744.1 sulfurtransferase [Streptomyces gossypii]
MPDAQDTLITVPELRELLAAGSPPHLLDVRWSRSGPPPLEHYLAGHLPGAVRVDLGADLAGPPGAGGRHPLPGTAGFEATMRRVGVRGGEPVVVYDQRDATAAAARLWWMLRYFGHRDVRVLDGGYEAWERAGGPVVQGRGEEPSAPGDFTAVPGGMPRLTVDEVPGFAAEGVLLDSRLGERFRGEVEPLDPVAGHIPGAVSAPTFDNSAPDGRFRPPGELRERFRDLGVTSRTPAAAYCGSGVTAAHQVLALRLAGIDAALYVGSWSEWIADPDREVATGP